MGSELELITITKRGDSNYTGVFVVGVVDTAGVADGGRNSGTLGAVSRVIGGFSNQTKKGAVLGLLGA